MPSGLICKYLFKEENFDQKDFILNAHLFKDENFEELLCKCRDISGIKDWISGFYPDPC
jgi:hypothetical protein